MELLAREIGWTFVIRDSQPPSGNQHICIFTGKPLFKPLQQQCLILTSLFRDLRIPNPFSTNWLIPLRQYFILTNFPIVRYKYTCYIIEVYSNHLFIRVSYDYNLLFDFKGDACIWGWIWNYWVPNFFHLSTGSYHNIHIARVVSIRAPQQRRLPGRRNGTVICKFKIHNSSN